jgi:hypothetical protein
VAQFEWQALSSCCRRPAASKFEPFRGGPLALAGRMNPDIQIALVSYRMAARINEDAPGC